MNKVCSAVRFGLVCMMFLSMLSGASASILYSGTRVPRSTRSKPTLMHLEFHLDGSALKTGSVTPWRATVISETQDFQSLEFVSPDPTLSRTEAVDIVASYSPDYPFDPRFIPGLLRKADEDHRLCLESSPSPLQPQALSAPIARIVFCGFPDPYPAEALIRSAIMPWQDIYRFKLLDVTTEFQTILSCPSDLDSLQDASAAASSLHAPTLIFAHLDDPKAFLDQTGLRDNQWVSAQKQYRSSRLVEVFLSTRFVRLDKKRQALVISHEVGHFLGVPHRNCMTKGENPIIYEIMRFDGVPARGLYYAEPE